MRTVSLFITLFLFWLLLSGESKTFLVVMGVISAAFCVAVAHRMQTDDEEGHPTQLLGRALTIFYPWLIWEIVKSSIAVARLIIDPRLPISPTMTRIVAGQRTPVGLATYANSITLTPGTVTTGVDGNTITVHALVRDGAIDLEGGAMDAKVQQFEGRS